MESFKRLTNDLWEISKPGCTIMVIKLNPRGYGANYLKIDGDALQINAMWTFWWSVKVQQSNLKHQAQ